MNMTVYPGTLQGKAEIPFSKAYVHRLLLASFLSGNEHFANAFPCECEDTRVMRDCLAALKETPRGKEALLDVKECGTALRFLVPVCAALGRDTRFLMSPSLAVRPMEPLLSQLTRRGVKIELEADALRVSGRLRGGSEAFCLPGNISSQFFSGLLFALALLPEGGAAAYYTPLQSADYVKLTCSVLEKCGIGVHTIPDVGWVVDGNGNGVFALPEGIRPERDHSLAAMLLAANALGSRAEMPGLHDDPLQADSRMPELIRCVFSGDDADTAFADVSGCPDLFPPLCVCAALKKGKTTVFRHTERLRYKESDRLQAMRQLILSLGGRAEADEEKNELTVRGGELHGGTVDSMGDHRIAMSAAVAALSAKGSVTVLGAECVKKSWPEFWQVFRSLGGRAEEV